MSYKATYYHIDDRNDLAEVKEFDTVEEVRAYAKGRYYTVEVLPVMKPFVPSWTEAGLALIFGIAVGIFLFTMVKIMVALW